MTPSVSRVAPALAGGRRYNRRRDRDPAPRVTSPRAPEVQVPAVGARLPWGMLVTLAVVFAYFTHAPENGDGSGSGKRFGWLKSYWFWRAVIIVTSAIPIAILTNAFRVSGTGVLAHYYGTAVADGFFHSFSGWAIYIVAFILLFGIGMILDRFRPAQAEDVELERKSPGPDTAVSISPVVSAEGSEL